MSVILERLFHVACVSANDDGYEIQCISNLVCAKMGKLGRKGEGVTESYSCCHRSVAATATVTS